MPTINNKKRKNQPTIGYSSTPYASGINAKKEDKIQIECFEILQQQLQQQTKQEQVSKQQWMKDVCIITVTAQYYLNESMSLYEIEGPAVQIDCSPYNQQHNVGRNNQQRVDEQGKI